MITRTVNRFSPPGAGAVGMWVTRSEAKGLQRTREGYPHVHSANKRQGTITSENLIPPTPGASR